MRNRARGIAFASLLFLSLGGTAAAQDAEEAPPEPEPDASWETSWSGFVVGTYNYNFSQPAGRFTPYAAYTSPHHSFLLNSAHLALAASNDNLSFAIEIDGGTDATVNSYTYGNNFVDIQEAWVAYTDPAGFGIKAGKFVTYNGIEVIESPSNPTISRGLLFLLAEPVFHTGALVTYQMNESMDAALGVVNGWDTVVDENSAKTIVGKFGFTSDQFLLTLSLLAGAEGVANNDDWRFTFDATGVYKMDKVDLWFQANSGMEQGLIGPDGDAATWFGVGVQPVLHVDDKLSLGGRLEMFSDLDGARSATPSFAGKQTLLNVSAAPAYAVIDHFTMRAEVRADISTGREDSDLSPFVNTDGDTSSAQFMVLTEAIATF